MCKAVSPAAIRARSASPRRLRSSFARATLPAFLLLLAGTSAGSAAEPGPLRDSLPPAAGAHEARLSARPSLPYNGTITGLDAPFAVAVNRYSRKIYVTESRRNRVAVFDRLGRPRGTFGSTVLNRPTALAFDLAGNLAVLSAGSREIVQFRPGGTLIAKARMPAGSPLGLAYEPVSRRLLVTDALTDGVWTTADGRSWVEQKPPGLTAPVGAAAARGRFYVVSSADARLMELTPSGGLIRALPLGGARRPLGITFPPSGNGLVVSSLENNSGLFGSRLGGSLTRFGGPGRMTAPVLPGSECTRVAFPDFRGNRVVAYDLPNALGCVQGVALRSAVTARNFRRIVGGVVAENDSKASVGGHVSVPSPAGRPKRYRLSGRRTSLLAGAQKKLQIGLPAAAAAGIRRALARRQTSTVTLVLIARNLAGDRTRVLARVLYRPRALRGLAAGNHRRATVSMKVER